MVQKKTKELFNISFACQDQHLAEEMTVYNILSASDPGQEKQAFHSAGQGSERKASSHEAQPRRCWVLLSVLGSPPFLPSPCSSLQTLPSVGLSPAPLCSHSCH